MRRLVAAFLSSQLRIEANHLLHAASPLSGEERETAKHFPRL
jgi:hypothetical protein